jgi:hypothetical protein
MVSVGGKLVWSASTTALICSVGPLQAIAKKMNDSSDATGIRFTLMVKFLFFDSNGAHKSWRAPLSRSYSIINYQWKVNKSDNKKV